MWRLLAVCLFWAAFLLTANTDDEQELLSGLGLAYAKAVDTVRPYPIWIGMLARGDDQPATAGPSREPVKARLVQLAQNQAQITDRPSAGQTEADASVVTSDTDRTELVVKLQRELKRVGCYAGTASGDWDELTRSAMEGFDARIGARLALKMPEPKFLTLIAGYGNRACGPPCMIGYIPNIDGKCTVPAQFANAYPTPPISSPEATADTNATSTGSWTASVAPASQVPFATSPMSPMPVTPTNTPLTTIAIIPSDQPVPQVRKTSGWGNAAFGLGLQAGAPSQIWRSSSTSVAGHYSGSHR
jgi:hypothetical protein